MKDKVILKKSHLRESGVTLLETMLVLAIAALLITMSISQYQSYKLSADAEVIKANVDKIAQAASYFYYAQCKANRTTNETTREGLPNDDYKLSPTVTGNNKKVVVDLQTALVDKGYLKNEIVNNPQVNASADGSLQGYRLQYVKTTSPRKVCTKSTQATTDPNSADCETPRPIGTIVGWQMQISVSLAHANKVNVLSSLTDATCQTTLEGQGVQACDQAQVHAQACQDAETTMNANSKDPNSEAYLEAKKKYDDNNCAQDEGNILLSFVRAPSFNGPVDAQSGLWLRNQTIQQFNQMYETANINYLLDVSHDDEYQYFTCGR